MGQGIEGLERALRRVSRLEQRITRLERPFKAAGTYTVGSVQKNFSAQGRPSKWKALAPSTIRQRRRGKGKGGVKILMDTAALRNSMSMRVRTSEVEVGTNKVQARRQHFGYPGGSGRGHSRTPARPYMMFQDPADFDAIKYIFSRHIRS
jgi:phage gpG-like protein